MHTIASIDRIRELKHEIAALVKLNTIYKAASLPSEVALRANVCRGLRLLEIREELGAMKRPEPQIDQWPTNNRRACQFQKPIGVVLGKPSPQSLRPESNSNPVAVIRRTWRIGRLISRKLNSGNGKTER